MPQYTYLFADLLTNQILDELPLYGVYCDLKLNEAGTFTGSYRLDYERRAPANMLGSTIPGRTAVYVDRDGTLVWGGIVWSRTYQSQSRSVQLYAETFDSYAKVKFNQIDRVFSNVDQRNIVRSIWTAIQSETSSNIGMVLPGVFPNDVLRTKTMFSYEKANWYDTITSLQKLDNGFDFYTQVAYASGAPSRTLLLGWPRLGQAGSGSGLVFQYPGSIQNYWYPENTSAAANRLFSLGQGTDAATIQSRWDDPSSLTAGYPIIEQVLSLKDLESQALLDARTRAEGARMRIPISVPTFQLAPNSEPIFGSYGLGDDAQFAIDDPLRFPSTGTATLSARVSGWTLRPGSTDGPDDVQLIIDGQDING